jgi:small-conductance mechanosensitive channel
MFLTYLVFCVLFLFALNACGELYYYHNFKIDILKLEELTYFLFSERVFTFMQQVILIFLVPFFLCLIFILCSWMRDKFSKQLFLWLFLLIAFTPYLLFYPYVLEYRFAGLILALVCLILAIVFWLVVFHIRSFELHYIGIHLLLIIFALTAFFDITRIDGEVNRRYYSELGEALQGDGIENVRYKKFIYVGSTDFFNLYYNLSENRGEVVRK